MRKDYLFLIGLLGLGLWVYLNSLRGPFIADDMYTIAWNFPLRDLSQINKIARQNLFAAFGIDTSYFRPLTQLSFALDFYFWGLNPLSFRLTNLVLHLINAVLVLHLSRKFLSLSQSALVSLIFVVHPVNMQAIAYISSRSDPFYVLFTLLAVYMWLEDKTILRPFCLLCFLLGLFSKEQAVVAPALIILTELIRAKSWAEARWRLARDWPWAIGFGITFCVYLIIRVWALGYPLLMESGESFPFYHRSILALTLLGRHLILLLLPVNLAFVHVVDLFVDPLAPQVLGPLLLIMVLGYLAAKCWNKDRTVALGLGWFLIAVLPVLNLTLLNLPLMESWLYLPGIGLFILVTSLANLAVKAKSVRLLAASIALTLLTMRAVVRSADWGNPVRLFEKNARLYPTSHIAWSGLGGAYGTEGNHQKAREALQKTVALQPDAWLPYHSLGLHYFLSNEDKRAEAELLKAISLNPSNAWPRYLLGLVYFRSGLWEKARREAAKALAGKPSIPMAYHLIGSTHLALGEGELAEKAFQEAIATKEFSGRKDFHAGVHTDLGSLLEERGLLEASKREFGLALRFDPENKKARERLGSLR